MAPYACLWAVLLGCVHLCSTQPIVVQHNCDLESGLCGWEYYNWNDMRQVGVVQPSNESAPRLGPPRDANPGTANGHYYYFYYPHSYEIYTLGFPNYQYICGLSFAYAVDGATTLLLSRWNFDEIEINTTVAVATPPDVTGPWQKAYHYITLPPVTKIYPLYFKELVADMGEAPPANEEMFLALDDLNITFCLPCNFDNLSVEGGIILTMPNVIHVLITALTNTVVVVANSSICPEATFIYTIESVFPAQLMPIFSLDPYSGLLSVDARGPFLDANGTVGNITISAYVLGSNYTNLSPAFKVYRTATFRQDQTIAVLSPPTINVTVGVPFSFHINATSPLDYTMPLTYFLLSSQTLALSGYVTVEPRLGDVQGLITVQQLASVLSPSKSPPSLTFSIVNQYGSNVIWTVTLAFASSPPLFTQQSYSFYVQPNSGVIPIGTLSIVDPHQRELQTPSLSFSNASDSSLFQLLCIESFDCTLLWIQSRSNQYRANYTFAIVTYPVASPSLRASANIFVGLYPINAYIPVITPQSKAITILDNTPAATVLFSLSAQDNDTGSAGVATFSLGDGNIGGFFSITPSGELTVAITPLYPTSYRLIVLAVDGGTPPLVGRAYVNITVIATNPVDCSNANYYSRPVIISPAPDAVVWNTIVGTNATLSCQVSANTLPMVLTRWMVVPVPFTNMPNYRVSGSSVVLLGVTYYDTGFYACNVTNQCGYDYRGLPLNILDVPNPPEQVVTTSPTNPTNVTISWVYISSTRPFVSTAVDLFVVQLRTYGQTDFWAVASLSSGTYLATVTGLIPYSTNYIRVLAVNAAGSTPSVVLTITTLTSVPQLSYFNVTALGNQSLLVAWQLEYDGGQPITSMNITVEALDSSSPAPVRAAGRATPVTYSVGVNDSYLLTSSFPQGWSYLVTAYVQNKVGTNTFKATAFVGSIYTVVCSFETQSCPWTLLSGQKITSGNGGPRQPVVDADGHANGHYWSLQSDTPLSNWAALSYPSASWLCGFSFDYSLQGISNLTLQTLSGEVLWSGTQAVPTVGINWNHTTVPENLIVPDISRRGLQFVVSSQGNWSTVALDNIMLKFCAPCSLEQLKRAVSIASQNVSVYLRMESNVSLQTSISQECSAAVLGYSISGVDPLCVESKFTVPDPSYGVVHVGIISPLVISAGTQGTLQVAVSIVGSDFNGSATTQRTSLGFVLKELTGECANSSHCDFSFDSCQWQLGTNVTIVMDGSNPLATAHYIHGYASRVNQVILSAAIGDDYCIISFDYTLAQAQMFIRVQGLGVVWSASALNTSQAWTFQSIPIGLTSVGVWTGRTLSFEVYGNSKIPTGSSYGVGNISLVPCTDCATRECHCLACMPGSYFSIKQDKCVACPVGYYCPESLDLPQPCPGGTYNPITMVTSLGDCLNCPDGDYSFLGQSACKPCPSGFSCSDAANPVAIASVVVGTTVAIIIAVMMAAFLLVAVALCLYCCYCVRKSRADRMKERAKYLNSRWNTQVTEQSAVSTPDVQGQKRRTLNATELQENVVVYSNVLYEGDNESMSSLPVATLHSTPALPQMKKTGREEKEEEFDLIEMSTPKQRRQHL
eukprot:Em0006g1113a